MGRKGVSTFHQSRIYYLSYQSESERPIWRVRPNCKTLVINVDDGGVLFDLERRAKEK